MLDIKGEKYNKLTAVKPVYKNKSRTWYWLFECECGKEKICNATEVRRGKIKSCGCLTLNHNKDGEYTRKHRMSSTRIYSIYKGIKRRCYSNNSQDYQYYGGRGITMCDEWLGKDGFVNFYKWSERNGYNEDLTIDRIDVNKGYSPSNCRWTTRLGQGSNKRNNRYLTLNDETHTFSEWCRMKGFSKSLLEHRLQNGWSVEEALTIPKGERRVKYKNGINRG